MDTPEFDPDGFESAAGALIEARRPEVVLVAHSVDSFGYAAALAAKHGFGFATDVFKLDRIDGELVATRGGYGQKVSVEVDFPGREHGAARPARQQLQDPRGLGRAAHQRVRGAARDRRSVGKEFIELSSADDVDMTSAEFILTIGTRHRRGGQGRAIQRARRCDRCDAGLFAADRRRRLAAQEPAGRAVRQDGHGLQAVYRDGRLRRDPASRRHETRQPSSRSTATPGRRSSGSQPTASWATSSKFPRSYAVIFNVQSRWSRCIGPDHERTG
jgi:hypothetical protein